MADEVPVEEKVLEREREYVCVCANTFVYKRVKMVDYER